MKDTICEIEFAIVMDLPDVLKKVSKFKDDFEKLLEDMKIFA